MRAWRRLAEDPVTLLFVKSNGSVARVEDDTRCATFFDAPFEFSDDRGADSLAREGLFDRHAPDPRFSRGSQIGPARANRFSVAPCGEMNRAGLGVEVGGSRHADWLAEDSPAQVAVEFELRFGGWFANLEGGRH